MLVRWRCKNSFWILLFECPGSVFLMAVDRWQKLVRAADIGVCEGLQYAGKGRGSGADELQYRFRLPHDKDLGKRLR
jgi:hypothetical protein